MRGAIRSSSWLGVAAVVIATLDPMGAAAQTPPSPSDWNAVDGLRPGTRIVILLETGERRTGRFRQSSPTDLTVEIEGAGLTAARLNVLSKSRISAVTTYDPVRDGAGWGALAGAAALAGFFHAGLQACGIGCENDVPGAGALGAAAVGAGIGSVVGFLADRSAGGPVGLFPPRIASPARDARLSRHFPARPSLRVGPVYSELSMRSSLASGSVATPGIAVAIQLSRYLSVHAEVMRPIGRFDAPSGSIPDSVLRNLVPPTSRVAGWSRGIESRRVRFMFSELVGFHPPPWGRFRVELLGGIGVQARDDRDYYDAYFDLGRGSMEDPARSFPIPGKYYVLNFEAPKAGVVLGVDTEVVIGRGLVFVPMIRYNRMGDPAPTISYGAGAHWRF